ncbi:MAG: hypothetical protein IPG31_01060 [Nitrosomonas sp.]|nr:hypothetical protein [Nitrosomonas sp.]
MEKMVKLVNKATNNGANFDMGPNPISLGSAFGGSLGGIVTGSSWRTYDSNGYRLTEQYSGRIGWFWIFYYEKPINWE